jgi:hypothetical protein
MYEWLLQQGISTLYSIHPQVPKQIKAVPKLENIHVRKYPYEQLKCDELLSFVDKIHDARQHGKKIGKARIIQCQECFRQVGELVGLTLVAFVD